MHPNQKKLLALAFAAALGSMPLSSALQAATLGSAERAQVREANALLNDAALYLKSHAPEQALAAFNDREGEFAKGSMYLFVLDRQGTMRASSGASHSLVGLDVAQLKDAAGKPFMGEILEAAKGSDSGEVEYHWLNPADNKVENKVSHFRVVGDYILCAGYYMPRGTAEQARGLLDRAVALVESAGSETAYKAFNDPQGDFVMADEYVFVLGLEDGRYRASGRSPNLIGTDVRAVRDAAGKPLFQDMIDLAKSQGSGQVDYVWRNPATNAVEHKHTLIQRVDDMLLGVGYYTK